MDTVQLLQYTERLAASDPAVVGDCANLRAVARVRGAPEPEAQLAAAFDLTNTSALYMAAAACANQTTNVTCGSLGAAFAVDGGLLLRAAHGNLTVTDGRSTGATAAGAGSPLAGLVLTAGAMLLLAAVL